MTEKSVVMKDTFPVFLSIELSPHQFQEEESNISYIGIEEYDHIDIQLNQPDSLQGKQYQCELCDQSFARHEDYRGHCLEHNGIEKPHICPTCGRSFSRKGNLKSHMQTHSGVKPHSCEFCGRGFSRKEDMLGHQVKHGLFFCEVCNIHHSTTESQEGCLLREVTDLYSCEVCGKSFVRKSNVIAHKRTHMGEKPFACKLCNKGFARKDDLEGHTLSHSGVNMYVCPVCSKGFNRKSNYQQHLNSHTKQVYRCTFCSKTFVKRTSYDNHLRRSHLDQLNE